MKAPTPEQLNDPKWWDANDPVGGCNRLFLVWEDGYLKRMQWMRGAATFNREGSMEVPELHHRPTKPAAPEWNGKGSRPTVGTAFEFSLNGASWEERVMLFDDGITCLMTHRKCPANCWHYKSNDPDMQFRPIRTKEQRQKDDLAKTLKESTDRSIQWCEDVAAALIADGWCRWE